MKAVERRIRKRNHSHYLFFIQNGYEKQALHFNKKNGLAGQNRTQSVLRSSEKVEVQILRVSVRNE